MAYLAGYASELNRHAATSAPERPSIRLHFTATVL